MSLYIIQIKDEYSVSKTVHALDSDEKAKASFEAVKNRYSQLECNLFKIIEYVDITP